MYVYLVINKTNNFWYVGKRSISIDSSDFKKYYGSGVKIKKAIKEQGIENFEKYVLEECNSKEELADRELYWINKKNIELGENKRYNIQTKTNYIGREKGFKQSKEHIKKRVEARVINNSYKWSDEGIKRLSKSLKGRKPYNKGKKCPEISKSKQGDKNPSARKVVNIETGKIYNTIVEAAIDNNINFNTLYSRISRKSKLSKFDFL